MSFFVGKIIDNLLGTRIEWKELHNRLLAKTSVKLFYNLPSPSITLKPVLRKRW